MSSLLKRHEKLVILSLEIERPSDITIICHCGEASGVFLIISINRFMKVSAEKQRVAEEVASILKLSVDIDTSPSERFDFFSKTHSKLLLMMLDCLVNGCRASNQW